MVMNGRVRLIFILWIFSVSSSSIDGNQFCSREESRLIRRYVDQNLIPIYEKFHLTIPSQCPLFPSRDRFYQHNLNQIQLNDHQWLCQYCQKRFSSESHIDSHFLHRHNDTLNFSEKSVCLADYCPLFRCEILKQWKEHSRSRSKKIPNDQQLILFRTRCASLINQCVPSQLPHHQRVELQHQMYEQLCAYLTNERYFQLPTDRKPLINSTTFFLFILFLGLVGIFLSFLRRSMRRLSDDDDEEIEKPLSDETISTATALLSTTPANGIIHSTKSPTTSNIRHRVRFRSFDDPSTEEKC